MRKLRIHKSSLFIAILAVIVTTLLEVPGRLVSGEESGGWTVVYERGWPWVYLRREVDERNSTPSPPVYGTPDYEFSMWGIPWLGTRNWNLSYQGTNPPSFPTPRASRLGMAAADLGVAILLVASVAAAWEYRLRRRPRLIAFGLGDLFAVMTLVCLAFGWVSSMQYGFRPESEIQLAGSGQQSDWTNVWYLDGERGGEGPGSLERACVAPAWLQSLVGPYLLPECFCRVTQVYIDSCNAKPAHLAALSRLDYLTRVEIWSDDKQRFDFSSLRDIGQMHTLVFEQSRYCDEEAIHEITQLPQLTRIVVYRLKPELAAQLEVAMPRCKIMDEDEDRYDLTR